MAIDKMLRVAGRASDGTAKALKTDLDGNINNVVVGIINNQKKSIYPVFNVKEEFTKNDGVLPTAIFSKNGFIYVGKENGEIIKYNELGEKIWVYSGNSTKIKCLHVDDDDDIYVGVNSRLLIKLDMNGIVAWSTVLNGTQSPNEGMLSVYQKGEYVYYGVDYLATDPYIIKVNKNDGKIVYWMPVGENGGWNIYSIAVDNDGNIYAATRTGNLYKLSETAIKTGIVNTNGTAITWVSGEKFAIDGTWMGKYIFVNGNRYTISTVTNDMTLVISTDAGIVNNAIYAQGIFTRVWTCVAHSDRIKQIKLGEGDTFYTCSDDNKVRKWNQLGKTGNWGTGEQVWSFDAHTDDVISINVDNSGNVFSSSLDNTVRKIDDITGKELFKFKGHSGAVINMANYNNYLYTIGNDKMFKKITNEQQLIGYRGL